MALDHDASVEHRQAKWEWKAMTVIPKVELEDERVSSCELVTLWVCLVGWLTLASL